MNKVGIYKITNKINGKFYIGSSKQIERRWWEHQNDLNKNKHVNQKLQSAWSQHGSNEFEFTIIETVDESQLLIREQFYLDTFKPHLIGYNISDTASGGDNFTNNPNKEDIRQRLSDLNLEYKNPMFGKNHSPEAIEKQKNAASGRYTLEWFISRYGEEGGLTMYNQRNQRLKDRDINYVYDNGLKGTKKGAMSQEMRDKISETKRMFKQNKQQFMNELQSGLFTNKQLSEKYGVSEVTVKYYKRKLS
jgi:group I intron endonuclease